MNRGIFVSRGEPDIDELIESAKGICKYDRHIFNCIEPHMRDIAECYLEVCATAKHYKREFFGLRDFYSLIKMLYWFCSKDGNFTWYKLEHAVRRNFSGLEIDPVEPFNKRLFSKLDSRRSHTDPQSSPVELIKAALKGENVESNSRYLLLISQNYSLIDMIQNYIVNVLQVAAHKVVVIFGSSFRHDQEYTEIVRNISRIKHSMEVGNTIILLNFTNLYESLYDALNQYYYEFAGQRYVYLGLGTHRVNCSVHEDFRLILLANRESVYDTKRFPIPLVNRLEKHFLNATTLLNEKQKALMHELEVWIGLFCTWNHGGNKPKPNEIFIGLNEDTLATLILYSTNTEFSLSAADQEMETSENAVKFDNDCLLLKTKQILLRCATADAIIRQSSASLTNKLSKENLWQEYFVNQRHTSLRDLIDNHINKERSDLSGDNPAVVDFSQNLVQITSNSKNFMSKLDLASLASSLNLVGGRNLSSCILQSFETQLQFSAQIKQFLEATDEEMATDDSTSPRLLIIQCDFSKKESPDLIACARHAIVEQVKQTLQMNNASLNRNYIFLLINLTRENLKQFIGFQVGYWTCYHIDELDETSDYLPSFNVLKGQPLSHLLQQALDEEQSESSSRSIINLKRLFKKLIHHACSLIVDTNIGRTIYRIELFLKLCNHDEFVRAVAHRLINLQAEKESEFMTSEIRRNWLIKEVADLKRINECSTLKRSCQNYIESKLAPLLAYLLSCIDLHSNLDILHEAMQEESSCKWKAHIWLNVLNSTDIYKISYASMRTRGSHDEELKSFYCKSDWLMKKFMSNNLHDKLTPCLPFFWILTNQLNELYQSFIESNLNFKSSLSLLEANDADLMQANLLSQYIHTIPGLFESTRIFGLVEQIFDMYELRGLNEKETFLDLYINDFVLVNCEIKTRKNLTFIKRAIRSLVNELNIDANNLKLALALVHFQFETIRAKISSYLRFAAFEPLLDDSLSDANCNFKEIDLDSCILCIKIFEQTLQSQDFAFTLNRLRVLSKLIQSVLAKTKDECDKSSSSLSLKHVVLFRKHDALRVIYLFIDNVLMHAYSPNAHLMVKFMCSLVNMLKIKYAKEIDFDSLCASERGIKRSSLESIHEFLGKCVQMARCALFRTNSISNCCKQKCERFKSVESSDCGCVVCDNCANKMYSMYNDNKTVCPICKKSIRVKSKDEFLISMEDIK